MGKGSLLPGFEVILKLVLIHPVEEKQKLPGKAGLAQIYPNFEKQNGNPGEK